MENGPLKMYSLLKMEIFQPVVLVYRRVLPEGSCLDSFFSCPLVTVEILHPSERPFSFKSKGSSELHLLSEKLT